MANDIAAHAAGLFQKFSETLDRLNDLQNLETDNRAIEGAESAYMIRSHFLSMATEQWNEIFTLMRSEILPFVSDFKKGARL